MRTIDYDHQLYQRAPHRFRFRAGSIDEARQWQAEFRPVLRQALGLDAMAEDLAGHVPTAECIGQEVCDGFTREIWRLTVEPMVALPFYLLRPTGGGVGGPGAGHPGAGRPLVLTPHGHNQPHIYAGLYQSEAERTSMQEGDRDIAVQAVREGYIAIAPTTRGFGETRTPGDAEENKTCSCRTQSVHGMLVGRTAIGERVWDISRLIDWALANLPVDPQRIAITGNSGGGTVSVFAGACETRIAAVMPGSYFCTFAASIGSIHHCDCNYVPGILRLGEMDDVAGLIAPRPFLAINGVEDPIFPIAATRAAITRLQAIYRVFGVEQDCQLYEGAGGHRYYAAGAWPFLRARFGR